MTATAMNTQSRTKHVGTTGPDGAPRHEGQPQLRQTLGLRRGLGHGPRTDCVGGL